MELPKVFEDRFKTNPEHKGKPKISYSQATSYLSEEYNLDYYRSYFLNIRDSGNDFSSFGTFVGEYIEHKAKGEIKVGGLSQEDINHLDRLIDYPDNCEYEDEVVYDFGDFVMEGYVDRTHYDKNNTIHIRDYKTGNIEKKVDYYASNEYVQTVLYASYKQKQGFVVGNVEVFMLGRKGNSLNGSGNFKMRLDGTFEKIPNVFSQDRVDEAEAMIRKAAEGISKDYKIFKKYFE